MRILMILFGLECVGAIILVIGFHVGMIKWCLMHVNNLGIMQWTNGASLTALLDAGVYGNSDVMNLDARLRVCFDRFKSWCRANRIESPACSMLLPLLFYVGFMFIAFVDCCICPALFAFCLLLHV
jgi:hypothetical protein